MRRPFSLRLALPCVPLLELEAAGITAQELQVLMQQQQQQQQQQQGLQAPAAAAADYSSRGGGGSSTERGGGSTAAAIMEIMERKAALDGTASATPAAAGVPSEATQLPSEVDAEVWVSSRRSTRSILGKHMWLTGSSVGRGTTSRS